MYLVVAKLAHRRSVANALIVFGAGGCLPIPVWIDSTNAQLAGSVGLIAVIL
jgi:hypothetical protein